MREKLRLSLKNIHRWPQAWPPVKVGIHLQQGVLPLIEIDMEPFVYLDFANHWNTSYQETIN